MRAIAGAAGILLLAAGQGTVAPLFPVAGATAEFPLVAAALVGWLRGVRATLIFVPAAGALTAALAGRDLGLYVVGYAAVVPALAAASEYRWPMGRWMGAAAALAAAGAWFRLLLVGAAVLDGADIAAGDVLRHAIAPGALADATFFAGAAAVVALIRSLHRLPLRGARSREALRWP
ncbi:hypothetical protein HRbin29_01215 [bacterium HR29]|jgi:hypothetical protein|nr:hypothetical protein HRbin29_01215 [bacterium HR29]